MVYQEFIATGMELTEVTETERSLKQKVIELLSIQNTAKIENNEEEEETLDLDSSETDFEVEYDTQNEFIGDEETSNDELEKETKIISWEYKKAVVQYWRSGKRSKYRSFQSVQTIFRFVSRLGTLYEWEKEIEKSGSHRHKLTEIEAFVFQKFQDCRKRYSIVHDSDLRRWACIKASELKMKFSASKTWLMNFKRRYQIVSRKITKVLSVFHMHQMNDVVNASKAFLNDFYIFFKDSKFNDNQIFNMDQSGFYKEIHSGRTLAVSGSKEVERVAQSLHATTYSYAIMPTISKNGKLLSPLFIAYPEQKIHFGVNVKKRKSFK